LGVVPAGRDRLDRSIEVEEAVSIRSGGKDPKVRLAVALAKYLHFTPPPAPGLHVGQYLRTKGVRRRLELKDVQEHIGADWLMAARGGGRRPHPGERAEEGQGAEDDPLHNRLSRVR
jgi:hypothetical protein